MRNHIPHSSLTLEQVFTAKHAWLLRWGLYFSRNDLDVAEDLVQDVFVRLLLSWDSIRDRQDVEPLLYSYLKYAHLTQLRRGRACSFQSLASVDFDSLFICMRTRHDADQLDLQNQLRRIVAYLLLRKGTAKFASICLLRCFHGFSPEQIMGICLVSRHAVDLAMRYARKEIRAHLASEDPVCTFAPPAFTATHTLTSPHTLTEELRAAILTTRTHLCWRSEQLRQRYNNPGARSLDCELLSHLVSCECCLDYVSHRLNISDTGRPLKTDASRSASHSRLSAPHADERVAPAFTQGQAASPTLAAHTYPLLPPRAFAVEQPCAQTNHAPHP